jgi:hypothetical protein
VVSDRVPELPSVEPLSSVLTSICDAATPNMRLPISRHPRHAPARPYAPDFTENSGGSDVC